MKRFYTESRKHRVYVKIWRGWELDKACYKKKRNVNTIHGAQWRGKGKRVPVADNVKKEDIR